MRRMTHQLLLLLLMIFLLLVFYFFIVIYIVVVVEFVGMVFYPYGVSLLKQNSKTIPIIIASWLHKHKTTRFIIKNIVKHYFIHRHTNGFLLMNFFSAQFYVLALLLHILYTLLPARV